MKTWNSYIKAYFFFTGSEKPGKLEVGGASRDSTGLGALEEGSSPVEAGTAVYLWFQTPKAVEGASLHLSSPNKE